jgi:hypothetical protein
MTVQDKIKADHKNIYAALCAAQLEFGSVTKGSVNPAFKTKYADLADVAGVVIPTLARHGVCVVQYLVGETLGAMRTEFVHAETESRVQCDVPLLVDKNNMQGMKSATTYAKRIGLESLSGVAPDDDDGNSATKAPPQRRSEPQPRQEQAPSAEAMDHAKDSLSNAETLDQLKAIWSDLPKSLQAATAVIAAKNDRKSALDQPILDDAIPY